MTTKILLVDDHKVFRMGLNLLLAEESDMEVVGEAGDGQEAIALVQDLSPDVVVMDITMPDIDGIQATQRIKSESPQIHVICLSIHAEKDFVENMFKAGATGYVLKESALEDLVLGVRAVVGGELYLSTSIKDVVVAQYIDRVTELPLTKDTNSIILSTKLHRPAVTPDLVSRDQLLAHLNRDPQRPFTLVSAPAGYGKTTLVSSWLEGNDFPTAWYQLDETDNDLTLFLNYLIAAIQTIYPDSCQKTKQLLRAPSLPSLNVLATSLISELDQIADPFILVLDDYHLIHDLTIHDFISELLYHPTPVLHLVVSTRQDPPLPLNKLRAKGWLTEIRQQALCFSVEETAVFLQNITHIPIDETTASTVTNNTEGWVTGLRLVALSLRHHDNSFADLADPPKNVPYVTEYLVNEILNSQPASVQEFLLKTSILNRLCKPLCQAICCPDVQDILTLLNQQNLFIIPLDTQDQWFRYHHLFQDILQNQLQVVLNKDEIADLHSKASHWFAENGLIDEALKHALAADNIPYAVQLVEKHRNRLMNSEQWHHLDKWLQSLPPAIVENNPKLLITQAWSGLMFHSNYNKWLNTPDQVAQLLLETSLAPEEKTMIEAEVNALRTTMLYSSGEVVPAIERAEHVLKNLHPESNSMRGQTAIILAMAQQGTGNFDRARQTIQTTIDSNSFSNPIINTKMLMGLCVINWLEGKIPEMKQPALQLLRIGEEYNLPESVSFGHYFLGSFHYIRNELSEAESHFRVVVENRYLARMHYHAHCVFGLALCEIAQDRSEQAWQVVESLVEYSLEMGNTWLDAVAQAFQSDIALRLNQSVESFTWKKVADPDFMTPMYVFYVPKLTAARAMLALSTPESQKDATDLLDRLHDTVVSTHNRRVRIDVLALQALLHVEQGDESAALEKLRESLILAEPGGFVRNFVDLGQPMAKLLTQLQKQGEASAYIAELLATFPQADRVQMVTLDLIDSRIGHQPGNIDRLPYSHSSYATLSKRERQVLRLLATDLTTEEIASNLTVSVATVRTHTKRIYSKLDVHSRMEAAVIAREKGLL